MKSSRVLLISLAVNALLFGSLIIYLLLDRRADRLAESAPVTEATTTRAQHPITSPSRQPAPAAHVSAPQARQTQTRPADLPAVTLQPGKTFTQTAEPESSTTSPSQAASSPTQSDSNFQPESRPFSAPTTSSAISGGSISGGGQAPAGVAASPLSNNAADEVVVATAGSMTGEIDPDGEGNNFVSNGQRVALESIEYLPDDQVALDISVTPAAGAAESKSSGTFKTGFSQEQELFRTRWGWQSFDQAQATAAENTPYP